MIYTKNINPNQAITILGKGKFGKDIYNSLILQKYDVEGIINSEELQFYANKSSQLIIGVLNRNTPYSKLYREALNAGFNNIFLPWDIYPALQENLGWRYWLSTKEFLNNNLGKIETVINCLADDHSKKLLHNITKFRLGEQLDYSHYKDIDPQYFNNLTLKKTFDCYVDGGAYNGDTYNELRKLTIIKNAVLFEPDLTNFGILKNNVQNAVCLPLALSDCTKLVSFNNGQGESSSIDLTGNSNIQAVSLDDILIDTNVDFIKLDLEGGESQAIIGASKLIVKNRPILAISLYHKPEDIWELPLLLKSICKRYKFYIRQHFYNSFDSVLYGIPE